MMKIMKNLKKTTEIVPFYISQEKSNLPVIHLLMIKNTLVDFNISKPIYHFSWIKNLSRLISSQVTRNEHRILICDRCLCHFKLENSFQRHRLTCQNMNKCRVILPDHENNILKFKNYQYKEKVPFVVYADIECLLEPVVDSHMNTSIHQKHVPTSVAYNVLCSFDNSLSKIKLYREKDCFEWFINELKCLAEKVNEYLKNIVPMEPLTNQQNKNLNLQKSVTFVKILSKLMISNTVIIATLQANIVVLLIKFAIQITRIHT